MGVQGLRSLLAGRVEGLVGVPGLLAVVAELGSAALSATHQPGAAGTTGGDDGKPEHIKQKRQSDICLIDIKAPNMLKICQYC